MFEDSNFPFSQNVPYNMVAVGSCSKCGGLVCMHSIWGGVQADNPTCINCGAVKLQKAPTNVKLPVIDME